MYSSATHSRALPLALVAASVFLFALHARAYGAWLIDDAGISIAYATNFARGFGLVAQPGAPVVEGFSDALWVMLLAVLARLGLLSLPASLKIVSIALVTATYAVLLAILRRVSPRPLLVGGFVLAFCSLNPAFVIWCTSGLENALYTLGIVTLAYLTLRATMPGENENGRALPATWPCGVVALLVATTRPDGILFVLVPPLFLFTTGDPRNRTRSLVAYGFSFGLPAILLLGAREAVFHHLLPNTYVAKGGVHPLGALDLSKLGTLLAAAFFGSLGVTALALALVAAASLARRRRFDRRLAVVAAFMLVALSDYMLLPRDRMDENRFGTPFYPLFYTVIFAVLERTLDASPAGRKTLAFSALASVTILASLPDFAGRALFFARAPSIGLFYVRRAFAERFDRYAETLQVDRGSIVLSDVGGMLLWSKLRVVDLAGLCDETLARTLTRDPPGTREYILGAVRPTFIHAADIWAKAAALDEDPRFASDYTPIFTYDAAEDPASAGHAAGLFVRRDVANLAGGDALDRLRTEPHFRLGFLPPPSGSFVLHWLDATPLVPDAYRGRLAAVLREKHVLPEAPPTP